MLKQVNYLIIVRIIFIKYYLYHNHYELVFQKKGVSPKSDSKNKPMEEGD